MLLKCCECSKDAHTIYHGQSYCDEHLAQEKEGWDKIVKYYNKKPNWDEWIVSAFNQPDENSNDSE